MAANSENPSRPMCRGLIRDDLRCAGPKTLALGMADCSAHHCRLPGRGGARGARGDLRRSFCRVPCLALNMQRCDVMPDLMSPDRWSLTFSVVVFLMGTVIILVAGIRLTGVADQLADRAKLGEALVGMTLMGAATSMSGSVLSVTAAWNGNAELAISNAVGGIAAQTVFLAVADMFYRRANLEHAAASAENIMQGAMLVSLLSLLLLATYSPDLTLFGVHPATPLLIAGYAFGIRLVRNARSDPMWKPKQTKETRLDTPDAGHLNMNLPQLWVAFGVLTLFLGGSGWAMQYAASNIVEATGISTAVMGTLLTSVTTSLPELITSITAVRRGALTLAVSGIIGGNAYDTLFAAFSDVAYREGSIYHTMSNTMLFWIALSGLMTGVLLLGLLTREKRGPGGIGFESGLIILFYVGAVVLLLTE
jgi:cation:H+ antiporter